MNEKKIEKKLVEQIKSLGGIAYKFSSPARRSVPDRIIILPEGRIVFVELKATGKRPTKAQEREQARIRKLGGVVLVIDSLEGIDRHFPVGG